MQEDKVNPNSSEELFIQQITEKQNQLFAYIYSLVGDHASASDILQESNIVMWRQLSGFDGQNFDAWAITICKYQVKAFWRDKKRNKLLTDNKLFETVSELAIKESRKLSQNEHTLQECVSELPEHNRKLIEMKYFNKMSFNEIAEQLNKNISALKVSVHRLRKVLQTCIERKLKEEQFG